MGRIKKHLASYGYAAKGIRLVFQSELNMRYHLVSTGAVLATNSYLQIAHTDWMITLILIGLVWMSEIFNTAVEKLSDRVTKEQDPVIGQVKDLASGAVLVVCAVSVVCALFIYLPYLL